MRWAGIILFVLAGAIFPRCVMGDSDVHIILSESGAAYREVEAAMRAAIEPERARSITTWLSDNVDAAQLSAWSAGSNLLVPVGVKAARQVAEHHAGKGAVLGLMVPQLAAARLQWPEGVEVSYVYVDQPIDRSFQLIRALFPTRDRVGLMLASGSYYSVTDLSARAESLGLSLTTQVLPSQHALGDALRTVLRNSDVLLLLPDVQLMRGDHLQAVLLASYRQRIPVIGYSPGQVTSGAVAAVHATPAQIGEQGAHMLRSWWSKRVLPPPQYTSHFNIAVNDAVARSMGITGVTRQRAMDLMQKR